MKYLFGIGLEKCGTSSMFTLMKNSKLFNTTLSKETFFFNKHYDDNIETFFKLFQNDPNTFNGYSVDITPSYIHSPLALKRISSLPGEKKIIIMFRDPVERGYSHYIHDLTKHISFGERSDNFCKHHNATLEFQLKQNKNKYFPLYAPLVKRALDIFGRSNIHIISLSELIDKPKQTLESLSNFLRIESSAFHKHSLPHSNEFKHIPQFIAQWKQDDGLYTLAQQVNFDSIRTYPNFTYQQVCNALNQQDQYDLRPNEQILNALREHYEKDLIQIKELLGLSFQTPENGYDLSASFYPPNFSCLERLKNSDRSGYRIKQAHSNSQTRSTIVSFFKSKTLQLVRSKENNSVSRRKQKQQLKQEKLKNAKDYSRNGVWPKSPELRPWFDQPNAKQIIKQQHLSAEQKQQLNDWVDNGYIIANVLSGETCDRLREEMDKDIWEGRKNYPNLEVIGVRREDEKQTYKLLQSELRNMPLKERQWMARNNNWRIHGLDAYSELFESAAASSTAVDVASMLFNEDASAGFTLSFGVGSEQKLHQDYAQFHIYPRNYLIGCWIALEDIHPDSGPLEYYPGTHKLGYWEGHDHNYPQSNLRTGTKEQQAAYFQWLQERSSTMSERKELIIKKGQAIFWHACLAHGGSKRVNKALTRHSLVLHFVPKHYNVDKRLIIKAP